MADPRIIRACRFCGERGHLRVDEGAFERGNGTRSTADYALLRGFDTEPERLFQLLIQALSTLGEAGVKDAIAAELDRLDGDGRSLANKVGVHPSTISRYRKAARTPTLAHLVGLAKIFRRAA